MKVGIESQYTEVYCDCGVKGKAGLYCNTVPSQATIQQGLGSRRERGGRWARGWARRARGAGAQAESWGMQAAGARRRWGVGARSEADARGSGAQGGRGSGEQGTRGKQAEGGRRLGARALGARAAGRGLGAMAGQGCALGALRLVFNLVFQLGIFLESLNEHCSL